MKTLIFNGSPRENGDTVSLINIITQNINGEYKIVNAYNSTISPCIDCRYCRKNKGCAINDEMDEIYDYIQQCDNVLIASPVYFSELTGKLLDVASRLQTYFCTSFFRKEKVITKPKKGAVALVGGGNGSIDKAYQTAKTILRLINCQDIHKLVYSHNTDNIPAIKDPQAIKGTQSIIDFFNNQQ